MEDIQLDYATLVTSYQTKINELVQQNIVLEAKNIILTKKVQELLTVSEKETTPEVKSSSRKKVSEKTSEEYTY